jgi:glycosyltransferase involved in cell wall biosynthesis
VEKIFKRIQNRSYDILLVADQDLSSIYLTLAAMYQRIPVIYCGRAPTSRLITEDTGWLIPDVEGPESYKNLISSLFRDEPVVSRRTQNAHDFVRNSYSWSKFCEAVKNFYNTGLL